MVDGRSKMAFKTWLDRQSTTFRAGIEVVAIDGYTGFKTAAAEPVAVAVMNPFHVVRWPATHWSAVGNASSNKHEDTVAAPATRSTASAACCAPAPTCSPIGNANG